MEKKSQLYVLVKAKALASYVFTVTEKSPKNTQLFERLLTEGCTFERLR